MHGCVVQLSSEYIKILIENLYCYRIKKIAKIFKVFKSNAEGHLP